MNLFVNITNRTFHTINTFLWIHSYILEWKELFLGLRVFSRSGALILCRDEYHELSIFQILVKFTLKFRWVLVDR